MKPFSIMLRRTILIALLVAMSHAATAAPDPVLTARAEKGDASAQFELAVLFLEGSDDVDKDAAKAVEWATRSADQGHVPACEFLGMYYLSKQEVAPAVRYVQRALEVNPASPGATGLMGLLHHQGRGIPEDRAKGLQMINEAAAGGNEIGVMLAAELKKRGHLDKILPREKADGSLLARAERGDVDAQFELSEEYRNGRIESSGGTNPGVMWRERAAEGGSAKAQFALGQGYLHGWFGYPKDHARAVSWITRAADEGLPEANALLGEKYFKGDGVPQDDAKAAKYLQRAVAKGMKSSEAMLGVLQVAGRGMPANPEAAVVLLRGAEARGDAEARTVLAGAYLDQRYGPASLEELIRLLRHGIKSGDMRAHEELGIRLYTGQDMKADLKAALPLLAKAAEAGSLLSIQAYLDYITKTVSSLGNGSMDQIVRNDLIQQYSRYMLLYGIHGNTEARLVATKTLTGFTPHPKSPPNTSGRPTLVTIGAFGDEAVALLRIYKSEGGKDREALKWLADTESLLAGMDNRLAEIRRLEDEYREKIAAKGN